VFATDLLNAFNFWTPQSRQQDAIKIRPNVTHRIRALARGCRVALAAAEEALSRLEPRFVCDARV
jgi:hypothetical protein